MAIEFCPLADDVGNVADWVAVAVGAFAAVATTIVAYWAYKTSNRATDIAADAKEIAQEQHNDYVAQRLGTARILGSLLRVEVGVLPTKMAKLLRDYDKGLARYRSSKIEGGDELTDAIEELHYKQLPAAEGVLEQLHTLPDQIGENVASFIGMSRDLAGTAKRINGRFIRIPDLEGSEMVVGYRGDEADFNHLRVQIRAMLRSSISLADSFNRFSGVQELTYESENVAAEWEA
ncbi:MAG: hypothetical protein QHC77_12020 [Stenotrophomonas sp.]|uniref:hypothetical protein n=1 Tax=Stenotrophomonas sp. TaxID=69392 RepID=UPI0029BB0616|nr:hypothetical protein [Stenotrophomonas sp.]MDX3932650.1 hypothetical protein [Stenotrophomonas sp.]